MRWVVCLGLAATCMKCIKSVLLTLWLVIRALLLLLRGNVGVQGWVFEE